MEEKILKLRKDHRWKSRPGYGICVLDRGLVRFDFPEHWILKHEREAIKIHDAEPPDDNCVLGVSHFHFPNVDFSGLPLRKLLAGSVVDQGLEMIERQEIVETRRGDLQTAAIEIRHRESNREAVTRVLVARCGDIHCLITFNCWADQREQMDPVWDEVLRSLVLGWHVADPTVGPVAH